MAKMIGIDLGTTNSVAAIVDGPAPRVRQQGSAHADAFRGRAEKAESQEGRRGRRDPGRRDRPGQLAVHARRHDHFHQAPGHKRGSADPEVQKVRQPVLHQVVEPSGGTKDGVRVIMGGKTILTHLRLRDDSEENQRGCGVSARRGSLTRGDHCPCRLQSDPARGHSQGRSQSRNESHQDPG